MQYVYVLQSNKDNDLDVGCTNNLQKRVTLHNKGEVKSTHLRSPLKLIFYEAFLNSTDAFEREQWLKTGWGRNQLRMMLRNTLKI